MYPKISIWMTKARYIAATQDGYKEFLTVLNQWAKKALIDTDFVSRTIDDSLKPFQNGTAGVFCPYL